ncbi:sigma-54-dependent transcriptional regulator [Roseimaritima multifibrata]|nr:sigma-54 dependent transcriptional regulator [Roseimaritima multifibrata]
MPTILVIDDDRSIHLLARKALEPVGDVVAADTGEKGLAAMGSETFDCVLLDIQLPDRSGLALFCEIHERDRNLPVIFMTSEANSQTAIEAMQLGAFDYLGKPLAIEALRELVQRAIQQRVMSSVPVAISADNNFSSADAELFVGNSHSMLDVFKIIGKVSKQDVPVLIRGESGTGKELVARALFQYSNRTDRPFLAVNCAALPDNLLESELFGHEKGAFTGADTRRIGKFEQCHGGTLFLDEIGDMAPTVQAKVLRVLQEQRFERVGGNKELKTDVRIVAATNQPLEQMVEDGDYREDLLYRLNGVTIQLPPLRERAGDIPLLMQYFLSQAKSELGKPDLQGIAPETAEQLNAYHWPGNVRQLRSVIRRAVLETVMPVITPDILPADILKRQENDVVSPSAPAQAEQNTKEIADGAGLPALIQEKLDEKSTDIYAAALQYMERYVLIRVLRETGGNQSQAAEMLGITRGKLRDRIQTYSITLDSDVSIQTT